MARGIDHLQFRVAKPNLITMFQEMFRFYVFVHSETIYFCLVVAVLQKWQAFLMDLRLESICVTDEIIAYNMIDVTMRVKQPDRLQVTGSDKNRQFILLPFIHASRIDDDTFFGFVEKDISIFLERVENKFFDGDHKPDFVLTQIYWFINRPDRFLFKFVNYQNG